ncbi:hypothetical protein HC174_12815 [Salinimicrobium sp. CDJ15-81-2]|nr:hypothetical protein [Salinimicrobium nanhaiense]
MKKVFLAKIVKYCPFNQLRIFLYKTIFKYEIGKNVKIGRSFILCESVQINDNAVIGDDNFIFCKSFFVGDNSKINSGNSLMGKAEFSLGMNSRIINDHYFDLSNTIYIGNNSWIAGKASQFWTHGSIHTKERIKDLSINIKDNVYVGSNVCFAPGVEIDSLNVIGLGSVVHSSFLSSENIIAGNPAKIIKQGVDWRKSW